MRQARVETHALLWAGDRPAYVTCPTLWEGRVVVLEATSNGSRFPPERGVQLPEERGKAIVCLPWCVGTAHFTCTLYFLIFSLIANSFYR